MLNLCIIIVIYNKLISNSHITKISGNNIKLIIADNSNNEKIRLSNKLECLKLEIAYVDMNGNKGLPKAYNSCIKRVFTEFPAKEINKTWFIMFDQDTELNGSMFSYYINAIKEYPEKHIFCPVILDSKGIMSPSTIRGKKSYHSTSQDFNINSEKFSYINSGMCINAPVFDKYQYDENLFLDMVDHDFVKTIRNDNELKDSFYVINELRIQQQFSGVTKNSFNSDKTRFEILCKDSNYFFKKWYGKSDYKMLLLRAVKLTVQHRKIYFLKYFLKIYRKSNKILFI